MNREEINKILKNQFKNILNREPTEREKEIKDLALKERKEYEIKRVEFYNNPLHWDNNKRRRHGLPVLRGEINKHRTKQYPSFRPTVYFTCLIEDIIEETLCSRMYEYEFFNKFVDFKNLNIGDKNIDCIDV